MLIPLLSHRLSALNGANWNQMLQPIVECIASNIQIKHVHVYYATLTWHIHATLVCIQYLKWTAGNKGLSAMLTIIVFGMFVTYQLEYVWRLRNFLLHQLYVGTFRVLSHSIYHRIFLFPSLIAAHFLRINASWLFYRIQSQSFSVWFGCRIRQGEPIDWKNHPRSVK